MRLSGVRRDVGPAAGGSHTSCGRGRRSWSRPPVQGLGPAGGARLGVFALYPLVYQLYGSFANWPGLHPVGFVGLLNYRTCSTIPWLYRRSKTRPSTSRFATPSAWPRSASSTRWEAGATPMTAPMESFWGSMQVELLNRQRWRTNLELAVAIADYIEHFDNPTRRHSLRTRSPYAITTSSTASEIRGAESWYCFPAGLRVSLVAIMPFYP